MIVKDGQGWGNWHDGGHGGGSGGCWMSLEDAEIHDPRYCKRPTDATYSWSSDVKELMTAKLVRVRRTTTVEIID